MEINKYTQFHLEIRAFKRWIYDLYDFEHEQGNYEKHFREFVNKFCPSSYWGFYDIREVPAITKREKTLYLHSSGLSNREIQKILKISPNTIVTYLKSNRDLRHQELELGLQLLIEHWDKFKPLIPNEVFIKYI